MPDKPLIAVIGGSGLYAMKGLEQAVPHDLQTPFGKPSAPILVGVLEGRQVAFLARHGIGHHISPTEVPYQANIYALKALGVERIISVNACGSLREDYAPGHIVIPDQLYDHTTHRTRTFFGEGLVAHAGVADPICPDLPPVLKKAAAEAGATVHDGGSLIIIEGPRFSTRTESNTYRSWGMSLIGMTAAPEAFLAREAEMCYAIMAHITDYDVWHVSEEPVSVEIVVQTLNRNTDIAQKAIRLAVAGLVDPPSCTCQSALASALITRPEAVPSATRRKLDLLVKKYLP